MFITTRELSFYLFSCFFIYSYIVCWRFVFSFLTPDRRKQKWTRLSPIPRAVDGESARGTPLLIRRRSDAKGTILCIVAVPRTIYMVQSGTTPRWNKFTCTTAQWAQREILWAPVYQIHTLEIRCMGIM